MAALRPPRASAGPMAVVARAATAASARAVLRMGFLLPFVENQPLARADVAGTFAVYFEVPAKLSEVPRLPPEGRIHRKGAGAAMSDQHQQADQSEVLQEVDGLDHDLRFRRGPEVMKQQRRRDRKQDQNRGGLTREQTQHQRGGATEFDGNRAGREKLSDAVRTAETAGGGAERHHLADAA